MPYVYSLNEIVLIEHKLFCFSLNLVYSSSNGSVLFEPYSGKVTLVVSNRKSTHL